MNLPFIFATGIAIMITIYFLAAWHDLRFISRNINAKETVNVSKLYLACNSKALMWKIGIVTLYTLVVCHLLPEGGLVRLTETTIFAATMIYYLVSLGTEFYWDHSNDKAQTRDRRTSTIMTLNCVSMITIGLFCVFVLVSLIK